MTNFFFYVIPFFCRPSFVYVTTPLALSTALIFNTSNLFQEVFFLRPLLSCDFVPSQVVFFCHLFEIIVFRFFVLSEGVSVALYSPTIPLSSPEAQADAIAVPHTTHPSMFFRKLSFRIFRLSYFPVISIEPRATAISPPSALGLRVVPCSLVHVLFFDNPGIRIHSLVFLVSTPHTGSLLVCRGFNCALLFFPFPSFDSKGNDVRRGSATLTPHSLILPSLPFNYT